MKSKFRHKVKEFGFEAKRSIEFKGLNDSLNFTRSKR